MIRNALHSNLQILWTSITRSITIILLLIQQILYVTALDSTFISNSIVWTIQSQRIPIQISMYSPLNSYSASSLGWRLRRKRSLLFFWCIGVPPSTQSISRFNTQVHYWNQPTWRRPKYSTTTPNLTSSTLIPPSFLWVTWTPILLVQTCYSTSLPALARFSKSKSCIFL